MTITNKCDTLGEIVVGVGGSESSFTALRYGLELARASGGEVKAVIVDAVRMSLQMAQVPGDILQRFVSEAERVARLEGVRIAQRAARMAADLNLEMKVEHESGAVVECLAAASSHATLLVVGKRGHRDEHGGFLGTNTELLARRTQLPVLLTPKQFRPINEVVVAYAAKEPGARNLVLARQLCDVLRARLRVVTVAKDTKAGESILAKAQQALGDYDAPIAFDILNGCVADELRKATSRESLLILGASGHSRVYHLLLGDVTVEAMRSANGPVLMSSKTELRATS